MPEPPWPRGPRPPSAAPGGAALAQEMGPGARTPEGQAAARLLSALSKAVRAFVLYDPSNAVVRQFLAEYRDRAREALEGGSLALEVRPFEIARDGEVLYREQDRERSLAFRLFRDGVRRLTLHPAVP